MKNHSNLRGPVIFGGGRDLGGFWQATPFALRTLALTLLLLLVGCSAGPAPTPAPAGLRITGSSSMAPALKELAAAFQAQNPNMLVEVQGSDTANGWEDLKSGRADVAAVSWWDSSTLTPQGYRLIPVARDALAVVVHPRNSITNVTALQLRALFAGEILNWSALGATGLDPEQDEPVIVSREDGSGTRAAFEARIMGDRRVTLNAIVMPSTKAVIDYVASHRLAVGYVTLDAVDERVRTVPVEGLAPAAQDAASGAYYLTRVLNLAARDPAPAAARAFLEFAEGRAGQAIWGKHHVALQ